MSCESQVHSRQSTFRWDIESLRIGGGVGGTRKVGGEGGERGAGCAIDDGSDSVYACRNRFLHLHLALSKQ